MEGWERKRGEKEKERERRETPKIHRKRIFYQTVVLYLCTQEAVTAQQVGRFRTVAVTLVNQDSFCFIYKLYVITFSSVNRDYQKTNKNIELSFRPPPRCAKSEPHQTWRGDTDRPRRGPYHSCTVKVTFQPPTQFCCQEALKICGNAHTPILNLHNSETP